MSISRNKKVAIILIAVVAVLAAAAICTIVALSFVFNAPLALLTFLDENGVTEEELISLLDNLSTASGITSTAKKDFLLGADALWQVVLTLNDFGKVEEAAAIYAHPPAAGNPFIIFKYSDLLKFSDDISLCEAPSLSPDELTATASQLAALLSGMADAGEDAFNKSADTLYDIISAENILEEVSFKSMYAAFEYAMDVSSAVDFTQVYVLNIFIPDFCQTQAKGIRAAEALLRSLDYSQFLDLASYMPDFAGFACAVCAYASQTEGFDIPAFSSALSCVLLSAGTDVSADAITSYISRLSSFNADALTEEERAVAKAFLQYLSILSSPEA